MQDWQSLAWLVVNRHTGGLEIFGVQGLSSVNVNRHTGGLET